VSGWEPEPGAIHAVLDRAGVHLKETARGELEGPCPFCQTDKPKGHAFGVNPDRNTWNCQACGESGGLKALAERLNVLAVVDELRRKGGHRPRQGGRKGAASKTTPADALTAWTTAKATVDQAATDYASERTFAAALEQGTGANGDPLAGVLNPSTRADLPESTRQLAWGSRLVVPLFAPGGRLVALQGRHVGPDPDVTKLMGAGPTGGTFMADAAGLDVLKGADDAPATVVLAEGVTDFLTFAVHGPADAAVFGIPGASNAKKAAGPWAKGRKVYLALDGDAAGRKATGHLVEGVRQAGGVPYIVAVPDGLDVNDLARDATDPMEVLFGLVDNAKPALGAFTPFADTATALRASWDREPDPCPCPWPPTMSELANGTDLDGLYPGLHVVTGGTGSGKTAWALAFACHAAREGTPVLYVTTEIEDIQLAARLVALETDGLSWTRVQRNDLSDQERYAAGDGLERLVAAFGGRLNTYNPDPASPAACSVAAIREQVRDLNRIHDGRPVLVVVDYLQELQGATGHERDTRDRVTSTAAALRNLAKPKMDQGWPGAVVLALSSVSRAFYGNVTDPDKLTSASVHELRGSAKESGGVEFSADTALALVLEQDTDEPVKRGKVVGLKQRNGPGEGMAWEVVFNGPRGAWTVERSVRLPRPEKKTGKGANT